MLLMAGGAVWARRAYKQSQPHPIWVPLPINPELTVEKRDEIIKQLKDKLSDRVVLIQISKDTGLTKKWRLTSDEEGARELGKRLFVKAGEMDTPLGKVPSINIGLTGKYKEQVDSNEIVMRIMDDVWKILGLTPPAKKGP